MRFTDVEWHATPQAWLSVPVFLALGILSTVWDEHGTAITTRLTLGLTYGVMLFLINILHSFGHILSGKLVGAPMDANLVTATRHVNMYFGDQDKYSRWIHIGRALGGPVFNILVGAATLMLWRLSGGDYLVAFANLNVIIGLATLAPIPSLDGWVIWGRLLNATPPA
jgi:hypothetical protein